MSDLTAPEERLIAIRPEFIEPRGRERRQVDHWHILLGGAPSSFMQPFTQTFPASTAYGQWLFFDVTAVTQSQ